VDRRTGAADRAFDSGRFGRSGVYPRFVAGESRDCRNRSVQRRPIRALDGTARTARYLENYRAATGGNRNQSDPPRLANALSYAADVFIGGSATAQRPIFYGCCVPGIARFSSASLSPAW